MNRPSSQRQNQTGDPAVRCPDPACGAVVPRSKWRPHLRYHPKHHNQFCPTCLVHHFSNETCPQPDLPRL